MDRKVLSIISLLIITLVAVVTGLFLINSIKETYAGPEFQLSIANAASYQLEKELETADETQDQNIATASEQKSAEIVKTKKEASPAYPKIKVDLVSWGYEKASNRKIDTVIIHSVYDAIGDDPFDLEGVLKEFKDYGVSPHYIINRRGVIYQLVQEKNIAYHAGVSQVPDGRTGVNKFSLGIELINDEDHEPTSSQYESLIKLLKAIQGKYSIKYILGHNDVAASRKTDPWNFNWSKIK